MKIKGVILLGILVAILANVAEADMVQSTGVNTQNCKMKSLTCGGATYKFDEATDLKPLQDLCDAVTISYKSLQARNGGFVMDKCLQSDGKLIASRRIPSFQIADFDNLCKEYIYIQDKYSYAAEYGSNNVQREAMEVSHAAWQKFNDGVNNLVKQMASDGASARKKWSDDEIQLRQKIKEMGGTSGSSPLICR